MDDIKNKILIIDDEPAVRDILSDHLKQISFDVEVATDGEDGLKEAFDFKPNLIVLDVLMPKMGGFEFLDNLRKDEWGKNVKVIMMTSLDDNKDINKAIERGSVQYIVKTNYNIEEIVKIIDDFLKK